MCDLEENPGVLIRASHSSCDTERPQDGRTRLILTAYSMDGSKAESRRPSGDADDGDRLCLGLVLEECGYAGTFAPNSNSRNAAKKFNPRRYP
jgi:hypothetical protein